MEQIISQLEHGTLVTHFCWKTKTENKLLAIRRETRQIAWSKTGITSKLICDGLINLHEVKEIRLGKCSKDFEKYPDDAIKFDILKCFVIFYGSKFTLSTLSIAALSERECELWTKGLKYLVKNSICIPYPLQVQTWLRREFWAMESPNESISLKEVKGFLTRLNCKISATRLREIFNEIDSVKKHEIGFDDFLILYNKIIFDENNIHETFDRYSGNCKTVTLQEFQSFLIQEQHDEMGHDRKRVSKFMSDFLKDNESDLHEPYFTLSQFFDFLFSKQNDLWNSSKDIVYQDMTRPLAHYYISSSHNTYLTGNQISSESSIESYARCLRMGCRCIELDCWDGPDGIPYVCHGYSFTTNIKFMDVIRTIKEHAFATSEYPVILSLEVNCILSQQKKMASALQEVFGEMLLIHPIDKNEKQLPSPHQLRRKIILKQKKLPEGQDEDSLLTSNEGSEVDIRNLIKNGIMHVENPVDHEWKPHFLVLTQNKLFVNDSYKPDQELERSEEEEEDTTSSNRSRNHVPIEELHFLEKWFYGRRPIPREEVIRLFKTHSHLDDGTFLVRTSANFVGEYCLSFWRNGSVNHCRIKLKEDGQQTKYYLTDKNYFDSLYSLITYYQSHPLITDEFSITLQEPLPRPNKYEGEEWYHKNTTGAQSEDVLKMIKMDGAFLVRPSENDKYSYTLTFRANKKIKHCRIKLEGRLYSVGTDKFESLAQLINYYQHHPKVKLRYAVSEDTVTKMLLERGDSTRSTACMDPTEDPTATVTVRTIYEYEARQSDELSFGKHAIITNVTKPDPTRGWWKGDYGGKKQLFFPAIFVQQIDRVELYENEDDESEESMLHRSLDMSGAVVELNRIGRPNLPWELRIVTSTTCKTLTLAVESKDLADEWYMAIKEAAEKAGILENQHKKIERAFGCAQQLSQIIIYCRTVPFNIDRLRQSFVFYEMSSFPESKAEKLMCNQEKKFFLKYHQVQISRIYPMGLRINSSNYNPTNFWNCGSQMVALNFQRGDKPMQLNQAKFRDNGNCGYLLKPQFMFRDEFDPNDKNTLTGVEPMTISIRVIGARHLSKVKEGLSSPYVEVEVIGAEFDSGVKLTTKNVPDNGLNPIWNESCKFEVLNPEFALLRFLVQDEDVFGESKFVGQSTYPITCLRTGYRSVCLQNMYSMDLELGSLLIHISIQN